MVAKYTLIRPATNIKQYINKLQRSESCLNVITLIIKKLKKRKKEEPAPVGDRTHAVKISESRVIPLDYAPFTGVDAEFYPYLKY